MTDSLSSNANLFADMLLFSDIHDIQSAANDLNKDLERISKWATQWKMNFNPDPNKQAQEDIFIRKSTKGSSSITVYNSNVTQGSSQKHLEIILDTQLDFDERLKMVSGKISRTIGLPCNLQNILQRGASITVYKTFIRPHLDYDNILYDQAYKRPFYHP